MTEKNPAVTVLTTVLNCERFIRESVESILKQTFGDFEFIIIDDGSTDNTIRILSSYAKDPRVRLIKNRHNIGRIPALNQGLSLSRGQYIAIQDADDISLPERLRLQYDFLEADPECVIVGANIAEIDEEGNELRHPMRPELDIDLKFSTLFRCTFANPSIMFRKSVLQKHDLRYDESDVHAEDFGLISKLVALGKARNFREILLKYRRHEGNNSKVNSRELHGSSIEIARKNLERLGLELDSSQVRRLRNLISARGISPEHVAEDVSNLLEAIRLFREKLSPEYCREIELLLKRMPKWLGKKNIYLKPAHFRLNSRISRLAKEIASLRP